MSTHITICDTEFTYDETTNKYTCVCRSSLKNKNPFYVKRHLNTNKHKNYLQQQQEQKEEVKQEEVKQEEVKQEEVKQEEQKQEEVKQEQKQGIYIVDDIWKIIKSNLIEEPVQYDFTYGDLFDPRYNDLYIKNIETEKPSLQTYIKNLIYDEYLLEYKDKINNLEEVKKKLLESILTIHKDNTYNYNHNLRNFPNNNNYKNKFFRVYYEVDKQTGMVNVIIGCNRLLNKNKQQYRYHYKSLKYPSYIFYYTEHY